jgi:hypothetical protein
MNDARRPMALACTLAVVVAFGPARVHAKPTPAQRCAAAKNKAAAAKIDRKLKCHSKAILAGSAVDASCLSAAEVKFATAIRKAETKGGCTVTGDLETLEAACDTCVGDVVARTPVTTSTSTTTSTTPSTGCTGPSGPCGSCGSGVCTSTCDDPQGPFVCVDGQLTGTSCNHDDDCPAGAPICAPVFGCPNVGTCMALCP